MWPVCSRCLWLRLKYICNPLAYFSWGWMSMVMWPSESRHDVPPLSERFVHEPSVKYTFRPKHSLEYNQTSNLVFCSLEGKVSLEHVSSIDRWSFVICFSFSLEMSVDVTGAVDKTWPHFLSRVSDSTRITNRFSPTTLRGVFRLFLADIAYIYSCLKPV